MGSIGMWNGMTKVLTTRAGGADGDGGAKAESGEGGADTMEEVSKQDIGQEPQLFRKSYALKKIL